MTPILYMLLGAALVLTAANLLTEHRLSELRRADYEKLRSRK